MQTILVTKHEASDSPAKEGQATLQAGTPDRAPSSVLQLPLPNFLV